MKSKPRWRGVPDIIAMFLAVPAVILLIMYARVGLATTSAWVYGSALVAVFGVSAGYHAPRWSPGLLRLWRRLDHSCIYLLIAGSYTPACLLALDPSVGIPMLYVVWILAALGVLKSFVWPHAPRVLNAVQSLLGRAGGS